MNRTTVRVAALVLAAGITISTVVAISVIAEYAWSAAYKVVLPRVVVTAPRMNEPAHPGDTSTEPIIVSSTSTPADQSRAASQVRN